MDLSAQCRIKDRGSGTRLNAGGGICFYSEEARD